MYLNDMVKFLENFKVNDIVTRKRKREVEEGWSAKQEKVYEREDDT